LIQGITLRAIGFPVDMFTALFGVARTVGWIATLLGLAALTTVAALWARPSLKALLILWILAP
jgi:citrate synthase